ncbi:hypothetical protein OIO90_004565 [Microbotryomycetes sp. JL221]|nr:hypothetical protein OIO90_004565 [Microbotryomycetes sp. JL221]
MRLIKVKGWLTPQEAATQEYQSMMISPVDLDREQNMLTAVKQFMSQHSNILHAKISAIIDVKQKQAVPWQHLHPALIGARDKAKWDETSKFSKLLLCCLALGLQEPNLFRGIVRGHPNPNSGDCRHFFADPPEPLVLDEAFAYVDLIELVPPHIRPFLFAEYHSIATGHDWKGLWFELNNFLRYVERLKGEQSIKSRDGAPYHVRSLLDGAVWEQSFFQEDAVDRQLRLILKLPQLTQPHHQARTWASIVFQKLDTVLALRIRTEADKMRYNMLQRRIEIDPFLHVGEKAWSKNQDMPDIVKIAIVNAASRYMPPDRTIMDDDDEPTWANMTAAADACDPSPANQLQAAFGPLARLTVIIPERLDCARYRVDPLRPDVDPNHFELDQLLPVLSHHFDGPNLATERWIVSVITTTMRLIKHRRWFGSWPTHQENDSLLLSVAIEPTRWVNVQMAAHNFTAMYSDVL